MEDNFFLSLVSTDSISTFKTNSCSNFTNILPQELKLNEGSWSVAVAECSYTSSFFNVLESCGFALFDHSFYHSKDNTWGEIYDCKLQPSYFDDPALLCNVLNKLVDDLQIKRLKDKKLFTYDIHTKKFTINTENLLITLIIKGQLLDLCGLETRHFVKNQVAFIGLSKNGDYYIYNKKKRYYHNKEISWKADSPGGRCPFVSQMIIVNSFLISSNIVKDTIYGSKFSNVLRTVPIEGPQGRRVVKEFTNFLYFPVKSSCFQIINIKVVDFRGLPIMFLEGNFSIVLHFKKMSK